MHQGSVLLVWILVQTGPAASSPGACIVLSCLPHWDLLYSIAIYTLQHADALGCPPRILARAGYTCKLLHLDRRNVCNCVSVSYMSCGYSRLASTKYSRTRVAQYDNGVYLVERNIEYGTIGYGTCASASAVIMTVGRAWLQHSWLRVVVKHWSSTGGLVE